MTATVDPTFASERLIAYEILTPSGNWSSFPPHRHDGRFGTSYHEETYYYRLTPDDGFAIQRLYTRDTDLDTSIAAAHGDLVLVHEGYTRWRWRRARTPTTSTSWPATRSR